MFHLKSCMNRIYVNAHTRTHTRTRALTFTLFNLKCLLYYSYEQRADKTALRNLSMVMRQLVIDDKEKGKAIEESVENAREAVKMDITDGTSWCK